MKHNYFLPFLLALSCTLWAEDVPEGYYDAISGKKDSVLKSTLSLIIRGGERYEYGVTTYHTTNDKDGQWKKGDLKAYGTWQALPFTDRKPQTQGVVWDMYSDCVRYYPNKLGDSGCSLNIEHCLPKSWWGGTVNEAYKDLFNLNPSDQRANTQKSNYAPGHVQKGDKFDNGSFRMDSKSKSQYGYICWEPAEEYRGDFARTYFYMATAYEYLDWTAYTDYISHASYLMFSDNIIQVLLDWHRADPVSDKEICRADVISSIQGNRNPFIDYPELVEYIWGDKKGQTVDMKTLTCEFVAGCCIEDDVEPKPQIYDTIINLPAITAALVNAIQGNITGSANSGIQSNGNASVTMGKSTTDGEISFSGLNLTEEAVLAFRASPYNSAASMQLDIYADNKLLRSIEETVEKETRNEIRYLVTIPAGTKSVALKSVGGSTAKRACLQELYLLRLKKEPTDIIAPEQDSSATVTHKELRAGKLVIIHNSSVFTPLGQRIR